MEWSSRFATGIEHIDDQHRMLFRMVADFRLSLDDQRGERTYGLLLGLLGDYARAHFDFEERCMERYRCPVAGQNRLAHEGFLRMLGDFRTRYESGGYRADDAHELVDALNRWLENHICRIDVQLMEHVSGGEAPGGGSTAQ